MSVDCYITEWNCVICARNRVSLCRHNKLRKIYLAFNPLEIVIIDNFGELVTTTQRDKSSWAYWKPFSNLFHTVPLRAVTAACVAKVFVTNWVMVYSASIILISDNGKEITSKLFRSVWKILGIKNLYTTTCHLQNSGQAERYNCTITNELY